MPDLITALQQHPLYLIIAAFVCGGWLGFYLALLGSVAREADTISPAARRPLPAPSAARKRFSLAGMCLVGLAALLATYGIYALLRPVYAGGVF